MEIIILELQNSAEYLLRIVLACICGGIVGVERSRRRKEAGIRTHIIVAVGATLMMIVSKYGFYDVLQTPGITVDAARIAANIITGISFLGAGVIFVRGISIKGLTTAAGLWTMAGIGLALGAGMYTVGIFTTIFVVIIQILCHSKLNVVENPVYETVHVTYYTMPQTMEKLKEDMAARGITIHHIEFEKNNDKTVGVTLDISRETVITCTDLSGFFAEDTEVKTFRL